VQRGRGIIVLAMLGPQRFKDIMSICAALSKHTEDGVIGRRAVV